MKVFKEIKKLLCRNVCICLYICICMYVCACASMCLCFMSAYVCACVHAYVYKYAYYVCILSTWECGYTHVHIYAEARERHVLLICSLETRSLTKPKAHLSPQPRAAYRLLQLCSVSLHGYWRYERRSSHSHSKQFHPLLWLPSSLFCFFFLVVDFFSPCSTGDGTQGPLHARPSVQSTTELENSIHIFGFVSTLLLKLPYLQISTTREEVTKTSIHGG